MGVGGIMEIEISSESPSLHSDKRFPYHLRRGSAGLASPAVGLFFASAQSLSSAHISTVATHGFWFVHTTQKLILALHHCDVSLKL